MARKYKKQRKRHETYVNLVRSIPEIVFLLDEQLEISGVGLISMNMAEQMVSGITEMSYRETDEKITEMTGQSIKIKFTFIVNVIMFSCQKILCGRCL